MIIPTMMLVNNSKYIKYIYYKKKVLLAQVNRQRYAVKHNNALMKIFNGR